MKLLMQLLLLTLLLTLPVSADAPTSELTPNSPVDQILDALDARGKNLKTFTANVTLAETTLDFGETTTRSGRVIYQDQGDGKARIRVTFDTIQKGEGKPTIKEKLEYALIDGKLIERNYRSKSQMTQQVIRPGQKIDLFKLGEGPFPLPIGQAKEEVHKQFAVTKVAPTKDDPTGTVHLQLIPNANTRLAQKMKSIDAFVDVKSHFPIRIGTVDRNETMDRTTNMTNVKINPNLRDQDFDLGPLPDPNWNVTEQPYQD
jgi:outer membrane lipoprotein-sorting protein